MKTKLFPLVIALALASCTTPSTTTNNPPPGPVGDMSDPKAETPPFIGMTKAQALARYGHPKKQTMTDEGENWIYVLNLGAVIGRAMIPFNFKPTLVRTGVLIFDGNGRVKKFNWDKEVAD